VLLTGLASATSPTEIAFIVLSLILLALASLGSETAFGAPDPRTSLIAQVVSQPEASSLGPSGSLVCILTFFRARASDVATWADA
jgi:hypothetical protein